MNILYDIWQYAYATYDYPNGCEPLFNRAKEFVAIDTGMDFCCIARFDDRIIISFRGTGSFRDKQTFNTWKSNFDQFPKEEGHIHNGIYDSWQPFKEKIDYYLSITKALPKIIVTGHSRGGSLATLCARHIAKNLNIPCSGIVFGSPKIGDKVFRNEFNMLPIDFTRVVNGYDIADIWPLKIMGFRHVGRKYWLYQPFYHKYFCKIHDHLPESYGLALKRLP